MSVPRVTPSLMLRGADVTARGALAAVGAMSRDRRLAMTAAVALIASLLAPWYEQTVTARGLGGTRTVRVGLSGWQALSNPAVVCVVAALAVLALLLLRSGTPVDGLGARGRQAARARVDGALVAAAGIVCVGSLLWTLADPPVAAAGAPVVSASTSIRWGLVLALIIAIAITALGALIAGATPAAARVPKRRGRPALPTDPSESAESAMPDFDFRVDGRADRSSSARPRRERADPGRPERRDRPASLRRRRPPAANVENRPR